VNAFWDGAQMTYGDGAGNARPLTSLDVAAHEMTHGVTENTAGLIGDGESGGLSEATSDIFGTAVEWYANNASDVPDYLIGEKVDVNGGGTPLRYQDRPSRDGLSADCWSPTVGAQNSHYSSGPLNHWFCARDSAGALWLYPLSGNAVFGPRVKIGAGWNGYTITAPGDMSGDGRADILARETTGRLRLYPGNGGTGFFPRIFVASGWQSMTALVTPGNWDRTAGNDLLARDTAGALWLYPGNNAAGLLVRRQIGAGWGVMTYSG